MSQHEIQTIEDIYRVVEERNLDGFLKDFETWLRLMVEMKSGPLGQLIRVEKFGWNDDGNFGSVKSFNVDMVQDQEASGKAGEAE